jgi:Cd2+/Zn2+-exporting ATPase
VTRIETADIALATVTVLLPGVLFGRVHMAGGMLIHDASVLVVILNGMRLLRARPSQPSARAGQSSLVLSQG